VMILRQRLAYAEAKDQFTVRQMAQNIVGAPLSRGWRFLDARRTQRFGDLFKMPRGGGHHFQRIASA
jgi:hypothetical protein